MRDRKGGIWKLRLLGIFIPVLEYSRDLIKIHNRAVKEQLKGHSLAYKLTLFQKPIIQKEKTL